MSALDFLDDELATLARAGLSRALRPVGGRADTTLALGGHTVINFASNNYMGLAGHPALAQAAAEAATAGGVGSGGSRLIVGNLAAGEALEADLASFHGAEAALLFNSGYQANVGVLSALAGPGDLVVSDALNHASIIDGCRLSRATVAVFDHRRLDHARELLALPARRRFLVSESLFSMDGDAADVAGLAEVARATGAALILDEAHAVGVLGPSGRGLAFQSGLNPDVLVGTFGKAFGSFGAYVVGSTSLRRYLLSRARSFVFTTGLPPAVLAASHAALRIVRSGEGDALRSALRTNIGRVAERLLRAGAAVSSRSPDSPIFPWLLNSEATAVNLTERLLELGVYAQGIRPPTVPRGTSRLRITVMATHTGDQVEKLGLALETAVRSVPRGT